MKERERFYLLNLVKRRFYYFFIRIIRSFKNLFLARRDHKFLFILCPPYSGSTMLNELISSSNNVSCNNNLGTREGQLLPKVRNIMFKKDRWDESVKYPWEIIKDIWMRYWDLSKPILLDKSVPNIIRTDEIIKVFNPVYYICMVRNPYAQVESIMRRNYQDARSAAEFTIRCLNYQYQNRNHENTLFFTYESLCDDSKISLNKIISFMPELHDIDISQKFSAHNYKNAKMTITNLNHEKISKISDSDFNVINSVFIREKGILEKFNYKIITR